MKDEQSKLILCLDFDGVCHSYTSGWIEATIIPDDPVEGLFSFLLEAFDHFTIAIFSSRSNHPGGIVAMKTWLARWALHWTMENDKPVYAVTKMLEAIQWPKEKPSAFLTIDDRAILFEGIWPNIEGLLEFKPWYKKNK